MDTIGDALLILGVAGVGKSTVGRHCALRWPAKRYVDVGTIREMLRPQHPELALSTYGVWRLVADQPTPGYLARGFERYAEVLWPAVTRFLQWTAQEGNNLVLDGAMMSPRLVGGIRIDGLRVHPRMLRLSDPAAHLQRLRSSVRPGSRQERRLVESFPLVRALQDYLEKECRVREIPVLENEDLEETLARILGSLARAALEIGDE